MSKRKQAVVSKRALGNRKPANVQKRARGPKAAARAQRSKQAFIKSPRRLRPITASLAELQNEVHNEPKQERSSSQETTMFDNRARAVALEAVLQAALQDDLSQKMKEINPKDGLDFALVTSNMRAYQSKLLEVTQANMQFIFDLTKRLAASKSPFEFLAVIAEFTGRRIIMMGKHSKELAAFWRIGALRV